MAKKTKNTKELVFPSFDRVLLFTFPTGISLILLVIFGQIKLQAAFIGFCLAFVLTFFLARPFFKELEHLVSYLKSEASGTPAAEAPRFVSRRREIFKIFESFNQIKMSWLVKNKLLEAQTLSDGAILENLPDALIMLNEDSVIVSANLAARQMLGGGAPFKKLDDVFPKGALILKTKAVLSGVSEQETVETVFKKHKKTLYLKALIEKLPNMTKNGATAVMVLQDITAFKVLEKSQTAFFANASHELKTPLSVLSGFIETLQGPAKDDAQAQAQFLPMMAEQTRHMTDLVQDLLALSRIQLNEEAPKDETVLVSEVLKSVIQGLETKAKAHQKKIVLSLVHELPPIKGRSGDFLRIFQNLIDNAIKYGRTRSSITVTTFLEKGEPQMKDIDGKPVFMTVQWLKVSVHNLGNPIREDDIPRLCERFFRIEQKGKSVPGTGLGLAITSQLIEQYDGTLTVTSSARQGTTFTVALPIVI